MVHRLNRHSMNFEGLLMFPKNQITRKPYFLSKRVLNNIKKQYFEVLVKFVCNRRIKIDSNLIQEMEKVLRSRYPTIIWELIDK